MVISTGMGRLSYLVSTNDLAMRGARVSALTDGNVPFLLEPISSSEGFLKIFFLLLLMCIEVRFNTYAFCTETDIHDCNW